MAPHVGARCLEKENGGRGVLLGGVPGVPPADVAILGGGVAGTHAAVISAGMGATVSVIDRNPDALRRVATQLGARVRTVFSTSDAIETLCRRADLVIASVLIPGAAAPKLITAETVKGMKPGSVIVDIAIDQGGCSETSRPTTHSSPTYVLYDVVHYCVTNMPGAVARTSTFALNNVTLPFVLALADKGYRRALGEDEHLRNGLNVCEGRITHRAVADALSSNSRRRRPPCGFDGIASLARWKRLPVGNGCWSQYAFAHEQCGKSFHACPLGWRLGRASVRRGGGEGGPSRASAAGGRHDAVAAATIDFHIQAPIVRHHDRGSGGGQTLLRPLEKSLHFIRTSGLHCRSLPSGYTSADG